jgi:hypothetical protein
MTQLYILLGLFVITSILVASILVSRSQYQKQLIEKKLTAQRSRLVIGTDYWYNSSKGFLVSTEPSCWAKVVSEPRLFGQNKRIVVSVLLKIGKRRVETTVPADSLINIEQINS